MQVMIVLALVPLALLQKYFDDYYHPEKTTIAVVGDFDIREAASLIFENFDPASIAHLMAEQDRNVLIQMDVGDFIIPNRTTELLQRVSQRPLRSYPSPLHGDLVAPLVGDPPLRDLGAFLSGEINN